MAISSSATHRYHQVFNDLIAATDSRFVYNIRWDIVEGVEDFNFVIASLSFEMSTFYGRDKRIDLPAKTI